MATPKKKDPKATMKSSILDDILGGDRAASPALGEVETAPVRTDKADIPASAEEVMENGGHEVPYVSDEPKLRQAGRRGPGRPSASDKARTGGKGEGPKKPKTFYVSDLVIEAIRLREFRNPDTNKSDIVEDALRAYLRMEIQELEMEGSLKTLSAIRGTAARA